MNKIGLVKTTAEKVGMTKVDCERIIDGVLESIVETVAEGEVVKLVGFGNFEPKERAARLGRNPKTGETVDIAAKKSVVFKVGKGFKEAVAE